MSDTPPTPETPKHRLDKEYEDPHYHDEEEAAPAEDTEAHGGHGKPSPRRKPVYRPRRRFYEE
jgi:hypothetical protein